MTSTAPFKTARASYKVRSEIVTPAVAEKWLETNTQNRRVKDRAVTRLVDDMVHGRWRDTGDTIKFSDTGRLVDGQHRLEAVVASGQTFSFLVVRGVADETQRFMDMGVKRSVADSLGMEGITNPNNVASAARLALAWETGRLTNRSTITDSELRGFIDAQPLIVTSALLGVGWYHRGLPITPTVSGAAYWGIVSAGVSPHEVGEFFDAATELRTTGEGDPKKTMRTRFDRAIRNKERIDHASALSMVVRAWNFEAEGRELFRMQATSRGGDTIEVPSPVVPHEVDAALLELVPA